MIALAIASGIAVAIAFPVAFVLGLHWLLGCAKHINALDTEL